MDENLKTEFVEAAVDHGRFTESGDSKRANKAHDKVIKALSKMKKLPDHGKGLLTFLLEHESDAVRGWAATYLLPLNENSAIDTLREIASGSGFVAFDCEMVLKLWKAGTLRLVDWP
jgi:hypothetical protein